MMWFLYAVCSLILVTIAYVYQQRGNGKWKSRYQQTLRQLRRDAKKHVLAEIGNIGKIVRLTKHERSVIHQLKARYPFSEHTRANFMVIKEEALRMYEGEEEDPPDVYVLKVCQCVLMPSKAELKYLALRNSPEMQAIQAILGELHNGTTLDQLDGPARVPTRPTVWVKDPIN